MTTPGTIRRRGRDGGGKNLRRGKSKDREVLKELAASEAAADSETTRAGSGGTEVRETQNEKMRLENTPVIFVLPLHKCWKPLVNIPRPL